MHTRKSWSLTTNITESYTIFTVKNILYGAFGPGKFEGKHSLKLYSQAVLKNNRFEGLGYFVGNLSNVLYNMLQ